MDKKNVIFIVMDTARAANFPLYGYERDTAPFLSKLAEESVVYENAISQHIWTLPSHTSMFKGEYGKEHQANSDSFRLKRNPLLEHLNSQGYTSTSISNNTWITEDFGWETGFDDFNYISEDFPFKNNEELWASFSEDDQQGWDSGLKIRKYIDYISECLKDGELKQILNGIYYVLNKKFDIGDSGARKTNKIFQDKFRKNEPNFFFINYIEPHGPYRPNRKYRTEYTPKGATKQELFKNEHYLAHHALNQEVEMTESQIEIQKALYDAEIKYLDNKLKELYEHLEAENLLEESYLIITSDHGEYFGEHDLYRHNGGLYPEVTNVPLLIRHPDGRKDRVESPVELRDIYNFIEEISNEEKPELEKPDYAFSEYYRGITSSLSDRLTVDRPKLLEYQASAQDEENFLKVTETSEEYWNIKKNERIEEETEKRKEMRTKIQEKFGEVFSNPENFTNQEKESMDKQVKEQLQKLGYMG